MNKFYKIILIFLSCINIIKYRFKKYKCANYFIINNNKNIYDLRSKNFFDLKTSKFTFNLVRINELNFITFSKALKIPNFFCYSIIKNFILSNYNENLFYNLILKLFLFLKINKLLLIDDTREMNLFSKLSKKLNIFSLIYMHGRFSKNSKIHKKTSFNLYFVWSNYFKEQLLKSNICYKSNQILVIGNPNLKKKKILKNKKINIERCLILDEDYINFKNINEYFQVISKEKRVKFFFKKKISRKIPQNIALFCKQNNIQIINIDTSFQDILYKYKIDSLIAYTSTGLLESLYYFIVPIKIPSKNIKRENEFNTFVEEKLVYKAKNPNHLRKLLKQKYYYSDLLKKRNNIWGNIRFKDHLVKNKIKKFVMN